MPILDFVSVEIDWGRWIVRLQPDGDGRICPACFDECKKSPVDDFGLENFGEKVTFATGAVKLFRPGVNQGASGSGSQRVQRGDSNGSTDQAERSYGPSLTKKGPWLAHASPQLTYAKALMDGPSSQFLAGDTLGLQIGLNIEHQKFGFGEVIDMQGPANDPMATINFEGIGQKRIKLNYAKLRII